MQTQVNQLINLYVRLEAVKQRQAVATPGSATAGALAAQAAALQSQINGYSAEMRNAALESDKVRIAMDKTAEAEAKARDHAAGLKGEVQQTNQLAERLVSMLGTMVIIRGLREMWSAAQEYAKQYYDQLNEIQVVTMKSQGDIANLTTKYRQMASELSVTSREIASAATTFYRQGLGDNEVDQRLRYTTQYAKIAAMDFEEAANLITATSNSMRDQIQGDIQRVTDVFIYLGDNAGTSAQEVGTAMQKTAASAANFGVEFEWLGAYIATVSETTRQAAEVVGTSLNAIMARLHSIKTTGFNQEDETKINDVAKALGTIDVQLLKQNGDWRDMTDIFNDVAEKWEGLNGKQQSYIATAVAGTRQQNTFIALMNDLSKKAEDGSRAWELYNGAINASGTTLQKYEVWEESVAAANNRLTASLEELYARFMNGDMLKGFYNTLSSIVTGIYKATDATGGLNIILPVLAAGIMLVHHAMVTTAASGGMLTAVLTTLQAHPVIAALTGIVAAVTLLGVAFSNSQSQAERYKESLDELNRARSSLENLTNLKKQFDDMNVSVASGEASMSEYSGLLSSLSGVSPIAAQAVSDFNKGLITHAEMIGIVNTELEKMIDLEKQVATENAMDALWSFTPSVTAGESMSRLTRHGYDVSDPSTAYGALHETFLTQDYTSEMMRAADELTGTLKKNVLDILTQGSDNADFEGVAYMMWSKLFQVDKNAVQGAINEEAKAAVALAIEALGGAVEENTVEAGMLEDFLMKALAGEDGVISAEELANAGPTLGKLVSDWLVNGLDTASLSDASEAYRRFLSGFMTDAQDAMFESMMAGDSEFGADFMRMLNEALTAGLNYQDVADLMSGGTDWTNLGELVRQNIMNSLESVFDGSEDYLKYWAKHLSSDIDDATAIALYQALANGGSVDDLLAELQGEGTVAEAIARFLTGTSDGEDGGAVEEATDGMIKTLDKATSDLRGRIDMLKSVQQELKDGTSFGGLDMDDRLELLEQYPQLASFVGDSAQLLTNIEQLIETENNELSKATRDFLLTNGDFFQSLDLSSIGIESKGAAENLGDFIETLESVDDQDAVNAFLDELIAKILGVKEAAGGAGTSVSEFVSGVKNSAGNIDSINSYIKALRGTDEDNPMSASTLTEMIKKYPQLMALIDDTEAMITELGAISRREGDNIASVFNSFIMGSEEVMKNSPFKEFMSDSVRTLNDFIGSLDATAPELAQVGEYAQQASIQGLALLGVLDDIGKEKLGEWMKHLVPDATADMLARPVIDAAKLAEAGWEDAGEGIATVFSSSFSYGKEGDGPRMVVGFTPILPDGTVLSPEAVGEYIDNIVRNSTSAEEMYAADDLGLLLSVDTDVESFDTAEEKMNYLLELLHQLQDAYYGTSDAEKSWLQQHAEQNASDSEDSWAKSNDYVYQVEEMLNALEAENGGVQQALEVFNGFSDKIKEGINKAYPELIAQLYNAESALAAQSEEAKGTGDALQDATDDTEDLTQAQKELEKSLKNTLKGANSTAFKNTNQAIRDLKNGSVSAADAFDKFRGESDNVVKALEDINDTNAKMNKGLKPTASDVSNIAKVLGMSAEEVLGSWDQIPDKMQDIIAEGQELYDAMNQTAVMRILGVGDADFSKLMQGIVYVEGEASEAVKQLVALGLFTLEDEEVKVDTMIPVLRQAQGQTWAVGEETATASLNYKKLVPTANNPFKNLGLGTAGGGSKKSGGGGGGGGKKGSGSSKKSSSSSATKVNKDQTTEVERMLDLMDQRVDIRSHQQSIYSAYADLFEEQGKLQGVIAYHEKEAKALNAENKALEKDIAKIEKWIAIKTAELAKLDKSSAEYKTVAEDLQRLQEAHQDYTKKIIENNTSIEKLKNSIKEIKDEIRDMQISLRQTIYDAIEDRENKIKNMLSGEVDMENTIIDLLKQRQEEEHNLSTSLADERIAALEKERDLIDEELNARKEQAEKEEELAKLHDLETKLNRISADPTRMKERMDLEKQIAEMRNDMAWEAAEAEAKARQDSIDEQIANIEKYKEHLEKYYEDLANNPDALIAAMKEILGGSDSEIIEWLKNNDQTFAQATDANQKQMVNNWQDMLDNMHGRVKTYWDEVEQVIAGGEEHIINFLKENSEDFAQAGKLQAEKYVDEWKKAIEDIAKALEAVNAVTAESYTTIASSTYNAENPGSGGEQAGMVRPESSKRYANGGLVDYTGLAWVDGTFAQPEALLNPTQTKILQGLVNALETVQVPQMSALPPEVVTRTQSNSVGIETINVNVEKLDSDADYEEVALRVCEEIMNQLGQGSVVGGIRSSRL